MTNNQDNYEEAIKAVNYCFNNELIPKQLMKIFESDKCRNLTKQVTIRFDLNNLILLNILILCDD